MVKAGPEKFCFCIVAGEARHVHIFEQVWDVCAHDQSFETVFDNSAMRWDISMLTKVPAADGSVRIIDETSVADMMEG